MKVYPLIIIALSLLLSGCGDSMHTRNATGAVWGTTYHIKYLAERDLNDSIVEVMRTVDLSLSPFEKASLISAVNAGERVKADTMLREVIDLSQQVCRLSGGAFDPTVAPLVNLWGFGYREGANDLPTPAQIDSALSSVGILQCGIDRDGYVIRKTDNTEFNFSAVAKGYGIDRIADMLRRNGCTEFMVEVGGEMALSGNGPSGDKWRIQIDAPVVDDGTPTHQGIDMLCITDCGIATSGNYRNHRTTSEGEVGHTISPMTGYPVATTTLSATVIAPNTALADALATAIMAMPEQQALTMIEGIADVEAFIVADDGAGGYRIVTTSGW